jgi:hypothetical protein
MSDVLLIAEPQDDSDHSELHDGNALLADLPEHTASANYQPVPSSAGFVVVGVRSQDCFAVPYPVTKSRRLPRGRMLAFDIEEALPSDADEIAVDALPHRNGWIVVAVEGHACQPLIDRISEAGGQVVAICPVALIAWQAIRQNLPGGQRLVVLISCSHGIDAFLVHDRQIEDWRWLGTDQELLPVLLKQWSADDPVGCHAFGFDKNIAATLGLDLQVIVWTTDIDEAIAGEAQRITSGRRSPPVNLTEGPLAPADPLRSIASPLKFALAGLLAALMISCLGMYWRARQYDQLAGGVVNEQSQLFEQTFPNEPVPVGIRLRFETEQRKLLGTRRSGSVSMPTVRSVVPTTHAWLSAMPEDVRYQLDRIEVLSGKVALLSGVAKSFSGVEKIADSLRIAGFEVPPVSTTKTSNGVTIRMEDLTRQYDEQ